ncbi:MAG TPA: RsmD family RNA methyltransferase [Cyclobacteriaceae bacterium]
MASDQLFHIANPEIQEYIFLHENEDEKKLVLAHKEIFGVPSSLIANQIQGRRKAKHKIDLWYKTKGIVYPPSINLEQSSSAATAKFKSSLLTKGKVGVDLTGGLGIDTFFLSQKFEKFYYVEPNESLLAIAKHNHSLLDATNIQYINSSAEEFLVQTKEYFDMIFIDPSRRNNQQKVFKLADCVPDVSSLLSSFLKSSEKILIKASPLLDIQQGQRELQNVEKVFAVSVHNEVKELLFLITKETSPSPTIETVDLNSNAELIHSFVFHAEEEKSAVADLSPPLRFLYEPVASILKAGAFKTVGIRHQIYKLHPSTHLFTSENKIDSFPGKTFKIIQRGKLDKKLKDLFPDGHANILTRNYPLSVEEIKKKTGLKEGGELFLICAQGEKEKHVLVAERVY